MFICIFTMFSRHAFFTENIGVLVHICVIIMSNSEETIVKTDVLDMPKNNEKNRMFWHAANIVKIDRFVSERSKA